MEYTNPIILQDFSDPDVIRVGKDYYMIASSFNYMPGVPVLHSINLVDWEIINYVYDSFPLEKFNDVCPGHGAWAPSIRYHNGTFYAFIPTPDEGIFVSSTKDPYAKWEKLRLLVPGVGLEDPCPIWYNDRCYIVHGYVKSRCGFNSMLGLIECDKDLTKVISPSVVIYDGHNDNPTIEGPKFNYRNGYFYILAPAGSVYSGWQVCLRSKNIYGPYESKIILAQGDTSINGPHQGALIDIDDYDNYAFIHFRDMKAYGRVIYLEPVIWHNDWPLPGDVNDKLLCGKPVYKHNYLIDVKSDYKIPLTDNFKNKLNLSWQTQANPEDDWYYLNKGLNLKAIYKDRILKYLPNFYSEKIGYYNFIVKTKLDISNLSISENAGFSYMGYNYAGLYLEKGQDINYLILFKYENEAEIILEKIEIKENNIILKMKYLEPDNYILGYNNKWFKYKFKATKGAWVGGRIGIFSRGNANNYANFKYFKVEEIIDENK